MAAKKRKKTEKASESPKGRQKKTAGKHAKKPVKKPAKKPARRVTPKAKKKSAKKPLKRRKRSRTGEAGGHSAIVDRVRPLGQRYTIVGGPRYLYPRRRKRVLSRLGRTIRFLKANGGGGIGPR